MIAKLVCTNSSDRASEIPLPSLPVTIGRGAQVDVQILDQWASRQHCRIVESQQQLVVQDLGSTSGTFVNGQPIVEAALHHGDTLTVGLSTFQVHLERREQSSVFDRIGVSWKKLSSRMRTPHTNAAGGESVSRSQPSDIAMPQVGLATICEINDDERGESCPVSW